MTRIAVIASHPIQYYAPLFRWANQEQNLTLKVFYLWNFGITDQVDQGFKQTLKWDIPLLDGYDFEFVPNVSQDPGTHHTFGLQNPALTQRIFSFKPDIILLTASYNYASIYQFLWQIRRLNIPIIFRGDSHRLIPETGIKARIKHLIISKIFQNFDACLYVGKANYDYFRFHGIKSNQLFFTPHAIDNQRFTITAEISSQAQGWKQQLGIPLDNKIILFAGKFEDKKRPLDLLKAFVQANLTKVSLLMVGAGNLELKIQEFVRHQPHFGDRLFFAPFQNQSLMPRTYAVADLFVLPSYGSGETWGLAINEAMAMGLPVIVSSHVGCGPDLVKPYENGLIFEAGNINALTECLREAMQDSDRLKAWGKTSQTIIVNYSYANIIKGLKEAINATTKKTI
ncbi:glycosyltransferase family 4 protein [Synechocystis salina LEGE 06155]|nr:glycosyltransferase family 4 protein [Synechocystis salina LEGE 06155]